jgi:hypothetical protein
MDCFPRVFACFGLLCLAACGGNSVPQSFPIGGTITGLVGSGLVLQLGQNTVSVSKNGAFTFPDSVSAGTTYSVAVETQPSNPTQSCTVGDGSGVVSGPITTIQVVCAVPAVWGYPAGIPGISAMVVAGSTIYLAGGFGSVGGETRYGLAAVNVATGTLVPWSPDVGTGVSTLAVSGNTAYVGRSNGNLPPPLYLAAVDSTTGDKLPWTAGATIEPSSVCNYVLQSSGTLDVMAVSDTTLYVGGCFTGSSDELLALDASSGAARHETFSAAGFAPVVLSLAFVNNVVYVGGSFISFGGETRYGLAAFDAATGAVLPWNPNINLVQAQAIAVSENVLVVGSNDGTIYGVGAGSGAVLWTVLTTPPAALKCAIGDGTFLEDSISALAVSGDTIYVGGCFANVGGQSRNSVAALSAATGEVLPWNPNANGNVAALSVSGSMVVAAGGFTSIGGTARYSLAVIDGTSGLAVE